MIALRGYTRKTSLPSEKSFHREENFPLHHNRVLVFDTETTIDPCQNLKFGSFQIYHDHALQMEGLFYDPGMLNETETVILTRYGETKGIEIYTVQDFIETVFYPEIFRNRTLCIGFNLAFDLSRLAYRAGESRKRNLGGFTFSL